jgi:hypothetical protein
MVRHTMDLIILLPHHNGWQCSQSLAIQQVNRSEQLDAVPIRRDFSQGAVVQDGFDFGLPSVAK